jgi:hypothetical protein
VRDPIYFCVIVEKAAVTLDHNWRWLHKLTEAVNCYTGDF